MKRKEREKKSLCKLRKHSEAKEIGITIILVSHFRRRQSLRT